MLVQKRKFLFNFFTIEKIFHHFIDLNVDIRTFIKMHSITISSIILCFLRNANRILQ